MRTFLFALLLCVVCPMIACTRDDDRAVEMEITSATNNHLYEMDQPWDPTIPWYPEVAMSYLNPYRGEPFYLCLKEDHPSHRAEYYWYFDSTLIAVTNDPSIGGSDWPAGDHTLRLIIYVDGNIVGELEESFWGMK